MASFPALPSGNNPYAATAAGYASSAASVFNGIRAAAAAHEQTLYNRKQDAAKQQQQSLQQAFDNENKLRTEGGIPQDNGQFSTAGVPAGRPGLTRPPNTDSDSAPQGGGTMVTEPVGGKQFYMPTKAEQRLSNGETYVPAGGLGAALQAGGGWDGKTPMTAENSHSIMQAINAAQPKDEPWHIDTSGKFLDSQGKPAAVMIGDKSGTVRPLNFGSGQPSQASQVQPRPQSVYPGQQIAAPNDGGSPGYGFQSSEIARGAGQAGGPFSFALPEKPDKPDATEIMPGMRGPNGGLISVDKPKGTSKEVPLPAGTKDVMTPAQKEADADRHERQAERESASKMKPAEARLIVKTKADRIAKADAEYKKAMGLAPGTDPEMRKLMTPQDKAEALDARQKEYQGAQNEYEESISAATGNQIPHNSWADTPAASPAAASPGRGGRGGGSGTSGSSGTRQAPPAVVTQGLKPGVHTFGNGQVWQKKADGSMVYVSGGQ